MPIANRAVGPSRATVASLLAPLATSDSVAKPSARYRQLAELRALPNTLMGGTRAMREAGRTYLPQHPAESDGSYELRLNSATLYNGFAETVTSQSGRFFAQPVVLGETVPPTLVELSENIDGQGRALTPFCADMVKAAFVAGISFILVDYPKIDVGATLADQQRIGARPYWVLITADELIGWRCNYDAGQQKLTQIRIKECTTEDDGEFGEKEVQRIRVLEPGRWQMYEYRQIGVDTGKTWQLIEEGVRSLDYIPLVPFYTNRIGYMEGAPPLRTLAELNQEHWISSSEQRRALSFLRFAMLALSGVDSQTEVIIGPDKVLMLPQGATAVYVEHSGSGIDSGARDIEAIERRMASAGMELRVENAGSVTATAAAIDSGETNAGLLAVAKALEDAIESALQITAEIMRLPTGGEVEVYDEFGAQQTPGTIGELQMMRSAGDLSQTSLWQELMRRRILDEDFDPEAEQVLLEAETSKMLERQQAVWEQQQQLIAAQQQQFDAHGVPIQGGV